MVDILNDYKSVDVPIGHFIELMPRLQPRYYSIGSSSQVFFIPFIVTYF